MAKHSTMEVHMNTRQRKTIEMFEAALTTVLKEDQEQHTAFLSTKQAAAYLSVGRTFLWQLTTKAGLKSYVLGKRRLYKREDLDFYVKMTSEAQNE